MIFYFKYESVNIHFRESMLTYEHFLTLTQFVKVEY